MKPKIHLSYEQTTITCACGAVYRVGSTKKNVRVDICAKCHPFFTGVQKIIDTGGRVERFRQKYGYIEGEAEAGEERPVETGAGQAAPKQQRTRKTKGAER